jgi:hypothetical protein
MANHDLTTDDGMGDFLEDLEDIQEDGENYQKLWGLVSDSAALKNPGISRQWDNVGFGISNVLNIGHELGHWFFAGIVRHPDGRRRLRSVQRVGGRGECRLPRSRFRRPSAT